MWFYFKSLCVTDELLGILWVSFASSLSAFLKLNSLRRCVTQWDAFYLLIYVFWYRPTVESWYNWVLIVIFHLCSLFN